MSHSIHGTVVYLPTNLPLKNQPMACNYRYIYHSSSHGCANGFVDTSALCSNHCYCSWWFQPTWKICKSQIGASFPNFSGWKCQKSLKTATTQTCSNYQLPKFIRSNYGGASGGAQCHPLCVFHHPTDFFGRFSNQVERPATSVAQWCPSTLDLQSLAALTFSTLTLDVGFLGVWGRKKHQKGKTCSSKGWFFGRGDFLWTGK